MYRECLLCPLYPLLFKTESWSSVAASPDEKEKRKKKNNKKPNYAYSGTGDEVLTILAMA